ncbi:hypothetical protein MC28_A06 (plasmid) [Bacillus thuringiensis MC28]|nr:hypothetical protein MC28_A06 [Bacillus thuringiensis MC28]
MMVSVAASASESKKKSGCPPFLYFLKKNYKIIRTSVLFFSHLC